MADVTQRFSIDVTGAVSSLDSLDQRMKNFGNTIDGLGQKLKSFNSDAKTAFNIDSGKASDAANKARRAFDTLSTSSNKLKSTQAPVAAGFQKTATALQQTGRAATQAQTPLSRIGALGSAAFRGLFGSLSQLGRIFGTRILIQGFGALQRAITSTIATSSQLQRSIREVSTILPEGQRNADALTASVRRLSDTFNLPIAAVTEGLYQTVSNQIGDAATSLSFLETAAKFSKAAVTDIDTSVLLLSGTLNAFGKTAADTENIAGKLFTTIELGRTRAAELANSLGRVLPVASELGVSLDEVLAGFATVTIAGIKTSEATTQLRGAFNALLKPTTATKDLLAELGFTSGEALIQARGMQGAFVAMREAAGGSITALSKFIPRVRGLNAALILSGSGAERFEENLKRIRASADDILKEKFELVITSDAETVSRQVNKLKNLFTVDLGQALLKVLARATEFIGGLDNIGTSLKTLVPIAVVTVGAIGALTAGIVSFNIIAAAATSLAGVFGISLVALGAAAAIALAPLVALAAVSILEDIEIANFDKEIEAVKELNRQILTFEQKRNAAANQLRDANLREAIKVGQEELAAFNKGFQKRLAIAKKTNDAIIKDQERVVKAIVAAGERIVNQTQKRISTEQKIQETAQSNAEDVAQELSDFEFKTRNKNFKQLQQFSNLQARANAQRRTAVELVRKATSAGATEQDIERARAAIERAQATAQEAKSIAEQTGNRTAVAQIEKTLLTIIRQKLNAENAITRSSERREATEKDRLARQQKELAAVKKAAQVVFAAPGLFDAEGEALTGEKRKAALKEQRIAVDSLLKTLAGAKTLDLSQIIEAGSLARSFDKQFTGIDVRNLSISKGALANLENDITGFFKDFRLQFTPEITAFELQEGVTIRTPKDLATAFSQQLVIDPKELQLADAISDTLTRITGEGNVVGELLDSLPKRTESVTSAAGRITRSVLEGFLPKSVEPRLAEFSQSLRAVGTELIPIADSFRKTGKLTDEQAAKVATLTKVFTALGGVDAAPTGLGTAANFIAELLASLTRSVDEQTNLNQLQQQQGTGEALQRNQQLFDAVLKRAEAAKQITSETGKQAQNTGAAATNIQSAATSTISQVGPSAQIASNWQVARAGAEGVAAAAASGGAAATARMGRFFPRFLAGGGFASRGTDTIPAMLSPGEFVVNARSSKRFFSQLQAINAGRQPVYRQDGGPVTNVGDINVTVSGGQESSSTGRQIARSIRRELRRGTSSL